MKAVVVLECEKSCKATVQTVASVSEEGHIETPETPEGWECHPKWKISKYYSGSDADKSVYLCPRHRMEKPEK